MQLFRNESLRDTGPIGHELTFGTPLFGQRYARHVRLPRAFVVSGAGLNGDEISSAAFARAIALEPPLVYPPLHLVRY